MSRDPLMTSADIRLRSYAFLNRMQPQFAAFVASNVRGYLPVTDF